MKKIDIFNRHNDIVCSINISEERTLKDALEMVANFGYSIWKFDFSNTDLSGVKLCHGVFHLCSFDGANLSKAKLNNAAFCNCSFKGTNLRNTNLSCSNLSYSTFQDADLDGSNFANAELRFACLKNVNISNSTLNNIITDGLVITDVKGLDEVDMACPKEGEFVAWKVIQNSFFSRCLVKLLVPADAKRISAFGKKCRCSKAKVLSIEDLSTHKMISSIINRNYCECRYVTGQMVYPDKFDDNRWVECSHGIHFFMEKEDALEYRIW